ncbi:unnamed protein product, partial [Scytosiphon promiscuus]
GSGGRGGGSSSRKIGCPASLHAAVSPAGARAAPVAGVDGGGVSMVDGGAPACLVQPRPDLRTHRAEHLAEEQRGSWGRRRREHGSVVGAAISAGSPAAKPAARAAGVRQGTAPSDDDGVGGGGVAHDPVLLPADDERRPSGPFGTGGTFFPRFDRGGQHHDGDAATTAAAGGG